MSDVALTDAELDFVSGGAGGVPRLTKAQLMQALGFVKTAAGQWNVDITASVAQQLRAEYDVAAKALGARLGR